MCFSQFAQFEPRPTFEEDVSSATRPEGAPPTKAELDPNLFGPIPAPPEWRVTQEAHTTNDDHNHGPNVRDKPAAVVYAAEGQAGVTSAVAAITTQTLEAVVVELANGTKLLICPL